MRRVSESELSVPGVLRETTRTCFADYAPPSKKTKAGRTFHESEFQNSHFGKSDPLLNEDIVFYESKNVSNISDIQVNKTISVTNCQVDVRRMKTPAGSQSSITNNAQLDPIISNSDLTLKPVLSLPPSAVNADVSERNSSFISKSSDEISILTNKTQQTYNFQDSSISCENKIVEVNTPLSEKTCGVETQKQKIPDSFHSSFEINLDSDNIKEIQNKYDTPPQDHSKTEIGTDVIDLSNTNVIKKAANITQKWQKKSVNDIGNIEKNTISRKTEKETCKKYKRKIQSVNSKVKVQLTDDLLEKSGITSPSNEKMPDKDGGPYLKEEENLVDWNRSSVLSNEHIICESEVPEAHQKSIRTVENDIYAKSCDVPLSQSISVTKISLGTPQSLPEGKTTVCKQEKLSLQTASSDVDIITNSSQNIKYSISPDVIRTDIKTVSTVTSVETKNYKNADSSLEIKMAQITQKCEKSLTMSKRKIEEIEHFECIITDGSNQRKRVDNSSYKSHTSSITCSEVIDMRPLTPQPGRLTNMTETSVSSVDQATVITDCTDLPNNDENMPTSSSVSDPTSVLTDGNRNLYQSDTSKSNYAAVTDVTCGHVPAEFVEPSLSKDHKDQKNEITIMTDSCLSDKNYDIFSDENLFNKDCYDIGLINDVLDTLFVRNSSPFEERKKEPCTSSQEKREENLISAPTYNKDSEKFNKNLNSDQRLVELTTDKEDLYSVESGRAGKSGNKSKVSPSTDSVTLLRSPGSCEEIAVDMCQQKVIEHNEIALQETDNSKNKVVSLKQKPRILKKYRIRKFKCSDESKSNINDIKDLTPIRMKEIDNKNKNVVPSENYLSETRERNYAPIDKRVNEIRSTMSPHSSGVKTIKDAEKQFPTSVQWNCKDLTDKTDAECEVFLNTKIENKNNYSYKKDTVVLNIPEFESTEDLIYSDEEKNSTSSRHSDKTSTPKVCSDNGSKNNSSNVLLEDNMAYSSQG